MEETLYKLVFEAKLQPGFKEKTVRKNLQSLFKADKSKMERMFSGDPIIIRKNLNEEKIRKYERAMVQAGACCRILSVKGSEELPPLNPELIEEASPEFAEENNKPAPTNTSLNWLHRMGRTRFVALCWLVILIEISAWFVPDYLKMFFGAVLTIQQDMILVAGLHILSALFFIFIAGLRLHDLNRSAWLWVFVLIPGLNLLFLFWLIFARGSANWNSYGNVPSTPGNLARLFGLWIPVLLLVAIFGSGWFYQEDLQLMVSQLPGQILELTEF